jgi:hypothetical protein
MKNFHTPTALDASSYKKNYLGLQNTQVNFCCCFFAFHGLNQDPQHYNMQCFGSGMDPDSIRSVDPYPDTDSKSGYGSWGGGGRMNHKDRKILEISFFKVLDVLF